HRPSSALAQSPTLRTIHWASGKHRLSGPVSLKCVPELIVRRGARQEPVRHHPRPLIVTLTLQVLRHFIAMNVTGVLFLLLPVEGLLVLLSHPAAGFSHRDEFVLQVKCRRHLSTIVIG